jgi:hypothetical protein
MSKIERLKMKKRSERLEKLWELRRKKKLPAVDTSKWVRPDARSIENALVFRMIMLELFDAERVVKYNGLKKEASLLYSIVHSRSHKNPQSLTNYLVEPMEFLTRLSEPKPIKDFWKRFIAEFIDAQSREKNRDEWFAERSEIYANFMKKRIKFIEDSNLKEVDLPCEKKQEKRSAVGSIVASIANFVFRKKRDCR